MSGDLRRAAGALGAVGHVLGRLLWAVASTITGWTVQLMGLVFMASVAVALLFRVLT